MVKKLDAKQTGSQKKSPPIAARDGRDKKGKRIAILAVICGLSGLAMVYNSRLWSYLLDGKIMASSAGSASVLKGSARHRGAKSPLWNDVSGEMADIERGDSLYTGNDGIVELKFKDGSEAVLGPNTMVVIEKPLDTVKVFSRANADGTIPYTVRLGQGSLSVKSGLNPIYMAKAGRLFQVSVSKDGKPVAVEGNSEELIFKSQDGMADVRQSNENGEFAKKVPLLDLEGKLRDTSAMDRKLAAERAKDLGKQRYLFEVENKKKSSAVTYLEQKIGALGTALLVIIFVGSCLLLLYESGKSVY